MLEWYDFAVYGYFATAIGQAFFPKQDRVAQLLSAFNYRRCAHSWQYALRHEQSLQGRLSGLVRPNFHCPALLLSRLPGYDADLRDGRGDRHLRK
jgi:hypothetical protein